MNALAPRLFTGPRAFRAEIFNDAWARTNFLFDALKTKPKNIRVFEDERPGGHPNVVRLAPFDWIEKADATMARIDARLAELRKQRRF